MKIWVIVAVLGGLVACWAGTPYSDTRFIYVRRVEPVTSCQLAVLQAATTEGTSAEYPVDDCPVRGHGNNHWYCRFTASEARVAGLRETLTKLGGVCAVHE